MNLALLGQQLLGSGLLCLRGGSRVAGFGQLRTDLREFGVALS
jgi:hypothetical protein